MKKILENNWLLICIVFIGSFLRFFNPLWDNGLFLHPDERLFVNASTFFLPTSIGQFFSINSPLNPHMFYYGSLLLYLYKLLSLISPFSLLITSRMVSAFFSSLTIVFVYLLGRELFSKKVGIIASIVFAFAAGSIQYAHFNTTESVLILLISIITYIDVFTVKHKKPHFLALSFLFVGIASAIKITGITFGLSPLLAAILLLQERKLWKKISFWFFFGLMSTGIAYIILAPYQLIDLKDFLSQQSYMQSVTYGIFKPPFVVIYQNTTSYIYQVLHVFPFIFGFIAFPVSLVGFFLLMKKIRHMRKQYLLLFLFVFPLAYFAWSGNWYAKFARYYLLCLPFLSLWAAYLLSKCNKYILLFLLICITLQGLLFERVYLTENTRVIASRWIYTHIPAGSTIATEYWDDSLPLLLRDTTSLKPYQMISVSAYDAETPMKFSKLASDFSSANYFVISSRRVFASIIQDNMQYSGTARLYTKLFSGQLGYKKIYTYTNYPFFISDDYADETFQSYDHPPVMIFQNMKHFSSRNLSTILSSR